MAQQEEGKTEALFADLGRKIDAIIKKTREDNPGLNKEISKGVQEVRSTGKMVEDEVRQFVKDNQGTINEVRDGFEKLSQQLHNALNNKKGKKE